MREVIRTNNAVLITAIEALLKAADIPHMVLDRHMSVLEGSLGVLPRRILVADEFQDQARQLLEDAGLGHELLPSAEAPPRGEQTDDAVLGGRLRLLQPRRGHRVGHDAILLAAAVGARPGDRAIDLGAGVGAAGLALAVRVPEVMVTLVDIDTDLAALAEENSRRNRLDSRVGVISLDVTASAEDYVAAGLSSSAADHVLMNPPFNNPAQQNVSPDPARSAAHAAPPAALLDWVKAAAWLLHSAGTLTLIWRAAGFGDVLSALAGRFGGLTVLPVHGRASDAAIRIVVRAEKGSRAPLTLLPGLILNDEEGRPTAEAERIMRGGGALPLAGG